MTTCLASVATLFSSNECLGWAVPLFLAIGGASILGSKWLYKHTAYSNHNFKLTVLNRLPSDSLLPSAPIPEGLEVLPLQPSTMYLEAKATRGFPVQSINFRCIAIKDIGTAMPVSSPVRIASIRDDANSLIFRAYDDGYNGMDGEYAQVRGLGKNRALYFEVTIDPKREWTGTLSFKARDSDGFCSYGRYALEIRENALPPTRPDILEG